MTPLKKMFDYLPKRRYFGHPVHIIYVWWFDLVLCQKHKPITELKANQHNSAKIISFCPTKVWPLSPSLNVVGWTNIFLMELVLSMACTPLILFPCGILFVDTSYFNLFEVDYWVHRDLEMTVGLNIWLTKNERRKII